MSRFAQIKKDILADLGVVDYSPKGSVDKEIVPLINLVNSHSQYVTTSSCAGRVSIFIEGSKNNRRIGGKGDGGAWLYFVHNPKELHPGWSNGLQTYTHPEPVSMSEPRRYVLYKFEPFILHVRCADHAAAAKLYSVAMACGFRESGIGPHNLVAIRISMRLDVPIGYLEGTVIHKMVTDEYLVELQKMSLDLFEKNFRRIGELTHKVEELLASDGVAQPVEESKEERRNRKRTEGLQKQLQYQASGAETIKANDPYELDFPSFVI